MAYKFPVYVDSAGRASLCEGGVFTDSRMILDSASDYCANDFAAFDIGTAREELSGSPFASARNMATNAALAFGGQGDPEAPICRFVDSAIRLHGEAIAAKAEARDATETSHRQAQAIRSLNGDIERLESELTEAREALTEWKRKADMAEADCELARRQRNAELAAHNELSAFIGELAPVLAALPLAVLASDATEGGKLANLYLRAELLADETTGERAARYRKES